MLGKNTLIASTAVVASMALAACDSNNNPAAVGGQEVEPQASGPLGLVLGEAVTVMSADANMHLVRVSDQHSTVTLNDLTFDVDTGDLLTFSITFGLPDGSTVTIDEGDDIDPFSHGHIWMGDDGVGTVVQASNDDGDEVSVLIGFGLDTEHGDSGQEIADEALFALARIDRTGDHPLGHDTYMLSGNETGTLPAEGTAVYEGVTIATLISDYVNYPGTGPVFGVAEHMTGWAQVTAHFLPQSVDVHLKGEGDNTWGYPYGSFNYDVYANDLPMDGSRYGGEIEGTLEHSSIDIDVDLAGDLLGAFYGDNAEATAGVFGAEGTSVNGYDYELVGGYGAYVEDQDAVEE